MSDRKIILVGYSGHGYVVAEAALLSNLPLHYYAEFSELENNPFNLSYFGFEGSNIFEGWGKGFSFILGIGDNALRFKVAQLIASKNEQLHTIIHPTASIAKGVVLGEGSFVARNVAINPLVKIGKYCILNTGSIIEHECVIRDGVHVAPGAVLAGNVSIGEGSFIGANAVIIQGITIGKNVVIGAGAVVISDVSDDKKVVGNPAKEL